MGEYSSEKRALFEEQGIELYGAILAEDGIAPDDDRLASRSKLRPAFDLLVDLDLVHLDETAGRWLPEDPTATLTRVVSPMSHEGTRLLQESSQWAKGFGALGQAWRSSAAGENRGPFTYIRGRAIGPYIESLAAECQQELITAQPQTGRDTGHRLTLDSVRMERDILSRGARILTLYQHSARRSPATREYAAAITDLGGEIRTLDEFFNRMIVIDRRIAVVPAPDDLSVAVAVREPTIVAYLVDVFLRSWERARPFHARDNHVMRHIAQEQRAMTMRMLIEGHSDPVSAKRLGVSPRTYAGYISDLKEEFEAETRFQLGYTIGRRGITPDGLSEECAED